MFNEIWDMQHDLNKKIGYDTVENFDKTEWFFMFCVALNDEIHELLECFDIDVAENTNNLDSNLYKINMRERDYKNAKIEAIDCLHFLISIMHIVDMRKDEKYFCNDFITLNDSSDPLKSYYHNIIKPDRSKLFINTLQFLNIVNCLKNRTNWKWWSKSVKEDGSRQFKEIIKENNIHEEISLAFYYLVNIFKCLDFSLDEIYKTYKLKWEVNVKRQDDGYDVRTKTEQDNKNLEEKI